MLQSFAEIMMLTGEEELVTMNSVKLCHTQTPG